MTEVTPVPIGDERVTTDDEIVGRLALRRPRGRPGARRAAPATSTGPWPPPAPGSPSADAPLPAHAAGRGPRPGRRPAAPSGSEDFARTIAAEAAKPHQDRPGRGRRAVDTFRFSAAEARTLAGEMVPLDASAPGVGKLGFTLRVPIGVVGAISPFNFPLNLVAHKVAPAIAAGCPVVLKPASQTPLSALALADLLLDECGLPAGLAQRGDRARAGPWATRWSTTTTWP